MKIEIWEDDINSDTWDNYDDAIDEWRSDIEELET